GGRWRSASWWRSAPLASSRNGRCPRGVLRVADSARACAVAGESKRDRPVRARRGEADRPLAPRGRPRRPVGFPAERQRGLHHPDEQGVVRTDRRRRGQRNRRGPARLGHDRRGHGAARAASDTLSRPADQAQAAAERCGRTGQSVSDGLVKILDGNTFVVSDSCGDIEASLTDPTGLFSFDTRFLSHWVLTVNGQRLNPLSTDDLQYFETRFFLVPGTGTVYVDSELSVIRRPAVGNGFREELQILNHDEKPLDLTVRIEAGSDFADLFEVKDALKKKGAYSARVTKGRLVLGYERETFKRATDISATASARVDKKGLTF